MYKFSLKFEQPIRNHRAMVQIVCETVVSSVTSFDNKVCLPAAVHYASESGKSGYNIKRTFIQQIRLI